MPANTTSSTNSPSGSLTQNAAETPTKKSKTKSARKTSSTPASKSSSAPADRQAGGPKSSAASVEILFSDLPNPFHPTPPPFIWIDHPQQNDRLTGPVYVIRLGAGGAENVELSIDGGVWQTCRLTSGYWWYDWSGIQPGRHSLTARMRTADGRWFRTPPRTCERRP